MENQSPSLDEESRDRALFDYSFVNTVGRIALYDDLRSAPRVIEVRPAETAAYIEALSSNIYEQARGAGGSIPYTVIREVSENFIHARFQEVVVSILDRGNTIRFADHGPGIPSKDKAQMPGFSSAVEPMKSYIRGVGSGLPIVREYLESSHGTITIEDNLGTGAVVTVSMVRTADEIEETKAEAMTMQREAIPANLPVEAPTYSSAAAIPPAVAPAAPAVPMAPVAAAPAYDPMVGSAYSNPYGQNPYAATNMAGAVSAAPYGGYQAPYPNYGGQAVPAYGYPAPVMPAPALSDREKLFLRLFLSEGPLGVTDMARLSDTPDSTTHTTMGKLEQAGLIHKTGKMRSLTPYGHQIAQSV